MMHPHSQQKLNNQVIDYESDPDICEALNEILSKESHHSTIESPEHQTTKARHKIAAELCAFKKAYDDGYNALMTELQCISAKSTDEDPLKEFLIDEPHQLALEDRKTCEARMQEGATLCDLLGYSSKTVLKLYEAATHLLEKNKLEEAKNGFYFLATIAPNYPQFWLSLGLCYALLKEHDLAIKACEFALTLDPSNSNSYLIFSRVYVEFQEYSTATQLLKKGILHANSNKLEPWASNLESTLQEAVAFIHTNQNMKGR